MYIYQKPALITEQFLLPSGGKLYGNNFDGNITLRAMTTIEERMRLGGQSYYETMSRIVNECIVDNVMPDGKYKIDSKRLTIFDFDAICVKLRIMTYGPMYKTMAHCVVCGKDFKHTTDLRECEYKFLPDDFVEPYEIGPLPMSGDTLGCRFLRVQDMIDIENKTNEIKSKNPDYLGDPKYLLEMERRIVSVNGQELDFVSAPKYVENMIGMDSDYYHRKIDAEYYGVVRMGITNCTEKDCIGSAIYGIRADAEFFRAGCDY